ncbi:MAG: hypothetical protein KDJ54_19595 [Candidatus Competibacteraceae bacterium]|nr:hypothetical protein [Candidatus Competibacteraceae bacterium]
MNLIVKLAIPVIGKALIGNNWQSAIDKVRELASDTTMSGKEKWAVVEQMLIDAGMKAAGIVFELAISLVLNYCANSGLIRLDENGKIVASQ